MGLADPEVDSTFAGLRRIALDDACWVDHLPGWLRGDEAVFDQLYHDLAWNHRTVTMYDRRLPEPRSHLLVDARRRVGADSRSSVRSGRCSSARYGEPFDSIGFNCYRDGADSVAWHGDRHRHTIDNPIVATVSVGAPRPFRLRPRGGGRSRSFDLGQGDLLVMGGACQHDWEHTVPKVRVVTGPRISITFRHGSR